MTINMPGKRTTFALLAVVLLPLLAGCARHSKNERYILVASNTSIPYWQTVREGFATAARQYGVTVDVRGPSNFDPQMEADDFHSVAASRPAGILVSVADATLMTPQIDAAIAAGIPVITVDSDAPSSKRLYFIGTNNLEAGRLGGARVAAQLNSKGNVVFFTISGQPNLEERLKGYQDIFASHPGIKIVDVFDTKGDSGAAMDKTAEYLARTGPNKIDAFVSLQSTAAKDVADAFKRANATGRLIVGMDVTPATLQLVKDGTIDSTISQKPYTMGLLGLKALDEIHHYPVQPLGKDYSLDSYSPFPAFVDTGVALVDQTNVGAVIKGQQGAGSQ